MATVPFATCKDGRIKVANRPLTEYSTKTRLSADVASAATALTVESIKQFAVNKILLIGEWGDEKTEIIKTHASTAPTGTTVTLAAGLVFAHPRGTVVYIIDHDQIELSYAATTTGSKSVSSAAAAIDAEAEWHTYNDATAAASAVYYFVRYKETVGNTFSDYTDPIPRAGWGENSVGHAIGYALNRNGGKFTETVTHDFCLEEINTCLKNVQGKQVHWPEQHTFNAILGQTSRGTYKYALSGLTTEIYDNETNKSIIAVRVGDNQKLIYKDPIEWEEILGEMKTTQVTTQASAGGITLEIDNSYDFDDSGTVNYYISGTKYSVTYTGVTRSATAGVLTGVPASGTGAITVTTPVDTNVFQDEDEGQPLYFTVRNQSIEVYPLPDASYDNMNVYLDYWNVATEVNSDSDTLDADRYDMVKNWLSWKMRMQIHNGGVLTFEDGDYTLFRETLNDSIRNKRSGVVHKMKPKIFHKITG